ncbi:MAG: hypothetical protein HY238_27575 [Acidobacteria bacterium]|nr:hypothetical protein [Acidobacteriota bacterium]
MHNVFSRSRHRVTALSLSLSCLLPQGSRLVRFGAELGEAKPAAVAAAGGAAGGAAALAAGERSCARSSTALFRATESTTVKGLTGSTARFAQYDELAMLASKEQHWVGFSETLGKTSVAKGLSQAELRSTWLTDPMFRAKAFEEVAGSRPERLTSLSQDLIERHRVLVPTGPVTTRVSVHGALQAEEVELYDAAGNRIATDTRVGASAAAGYRERAHRIFEEVLETVPPSKLESEADVAEAPIRPPAARSPARSMPIASSSAPA